ncbi:MAG TPA: hypothetical protein VK395_00435 [Gemmataceae bacterium]|nr:hypothetical protein [Gemmataceae bacterium]
MFGLTQLRTWILIFVLLLGILVGSTFRMPTSQNSSRLSESLADPHDLTQKLRDHELSLYYVEDRRGTTVYFTADPRPIQELMSLPVGAMENHPNLAVQWKGTVRFSKISPGVFADTSDWGDFGHQIGDYLVFGDPSLLRQVERVIAKD